jgi:hypothetical protein
VADETLRSPPAASNGGMKETQEPQGMCQMNGQASRRLAN